VNEFKKSINCSREFLRNNKIARVYGEFE